MEEKDKPVKMDKKPPRPKRRDQPYGFRLSEKETLQKRVNLMADEKLEDAALAFEQALRFDPNNVETLLKLGYAKFHLDEHVDALRSL